MLSVVGKCGKTKSIAFVVMGHTTTGGPLGTRVVFFATTSDGKLCKADVLIRMESHLKFVVGAYKAERASPLELLTTTSNDETFSRLLSQLGLGVISRFSSYGSGPSLFQGRSSDSDHYFEICNGQVGGGLGRTPGL